MAAMLKMLPAALMASSKTSDAACLSSPCLLTIVKPWRQCMHSVAGALHAHAGRDALRRPLGA